MYGLELTGGLSPVSMSILTSLVLPISSLLLEKASPYCSHSSSNFCLISVVMSLSCNCTCVDLAHLLENKEKQYQVGFQVVSHAFGHLVLWFSQVFLDLLFTGYLNVVCVYGWFFCKGDHGVSTYIQVINFA